MAIPSWGDAFQISVSSATDKQLTGEPIAVLPDGRIIVTWAGPFETGDGDGSGFGWGVRARILNTDGSPATEEFVVNTTTTNEQDSPHVAVLSDGRFVIGFNSNENGDGGATGDNCLRARVFNSDGTPANYNGSTNDFVVNSIPGYFQDSAVPVALPGGNFAFAFHSVVVEDAFGDQQIEMRLFGPDGPLANEFSVNQRTDSAESDPSAAVLADGRVVVTWFDPFAARNITVRIIDPDGSDTINQFVVPTSATPFPESSSLSSAHVAALADGGFVIAWRFPRPEIESGGDGSVSAIRGRVFNSDGTAREIDGSAADFLINTSAANDQSRPNVIGLADGSFFVTWSSKGDTQGNFENTILGRHFNADGTPDGTDFAIADLGQAGGGAYTLANVPLEMPDGRIFTVVNGSEGGPFQTVQGQFLDARTDGVVRNGTSASEQIAGANFADTLNGNDGNDYLAGGDGDDTLNGGAGNDTLAPGDGHNTLRGGDGFDTASYAFVSGAVIVNFEAGLIGGVAANDTWDSIEAVIGSSFADTLIGSASADRLGGGPGGDQLVGLGGDDVLDGGSGVDYLAGGPGADLLYGREDGDALHGQEGDDTIFGGTGDDVLVGFFGADTLNGDADNDTIIGDDGDDLVGADDHLDGGDGNDQMFGYRGNDTLNGGAGNDYLSGGLGNDTLDGGSGDDSIHGEEGNDTANGGAGNDALVGYAGDDALNGDAGNDTLIGNEGNDTLNGGDGNDLTYGYDGTDTVNGGLGGDFAAGGAGNDVLHGNDGGDVLDGEDDNDQLFGDDGGDNLNGNNGNDQLFGGAGNDGLTGRDGDDVLDGGAGNDFLIGDRAEGGGTAGNDTFVFHTGTGNDNIADFDGGAGTTAGVGDVIDIRDFGFADFNAVMAAASDVNGGVYIALTPGGEDAIFIESFSKAQLAADDFLLS